MNGCMTADKSTPARDSIPEPEEDTKRKFREALEHKKHRDGESHIDADPKPPVDTHGPVAEKRVFRRKSG